MRVLNVTDNYPPARGGLERAVAAGSVGLSQRGHEVMVATLARDDAPARGLLDGVEIFRLEGWIKHLRRFAADEGHQYHPTQRDPGLVAALQRLVDQLRPDVVHVHGWILYSLLRVNLLPDTALVVGLHDFSLICNNKILLRDGRICSGPAPGKCLRCAVGTYGPVKGPALALGLLARRDGLPRVQRFVANSSYVADISSQGSGIDRDRFEVIAPPMPDVAVTSVLPRPEFLPRGPFILYVGAMGPHKGLDVLLEAHARLGRGVPLVILGIPRNDSPNCDFPNVTMRQNVPHDEVMACWQAATVGVVPSTCAEAFGLVAVEAMSVGTPLVVTRVGGLQEVVVDGQTGLIVPPQDPDALAKAIGTLLGDPATRAAMAVAGVKRSRQYLASAVLPTLEDCYERALVEASDGRPQP